MAEVLQIALSDVWHWIGTVGLIYISGQAIAAPLYWVHQLKELKRRQRGWRQIDN